MNNQSINFLSDKYEIIRILGSGNFSEVYLARHLILKSECAIKVIHKDSTNQLVVLSEAELLKSLNHPSIPRLYDICEDDTCFYLIEEYVNGESLEEFLSHHKSVSIQRFCEFCEQLCDFYTYLHTFYASPIFYQDLKPEHIFVCGSKLMLIDFGMILDTDVGTDQFPLPGNADFSAPEVLTDGEFSVSADVYTLGKMLQYLLTYVKIPISSNLQDIINKATDSLPELRFETAKSLRQAILAELQTCQAPHLYPTIAVIGGCSGCGCTYTAISITCCLNSMNIPCFYFEENDSNQLRNLRHFSGRPTFRAQNGYLSAGEFRGFPRYGPGILIPDIPASSRVLDFGTSFEPDLLSTADYIVLVVDPSLWKRSTCMDVYEKLRPFQSKVSVVLSPGNSAAARDYSHRFHTFIYCLIDVDSPFSVHPVQEELWNQLFFQRRKAKRWFLFRKK